MCYNSVYNASELSANAIIKLHPPRQGQHVAALIDTGAIRSVVGLATAQRIARAAGRKFSLTAS